MDLLELRLEIERREEHSKTMLCQCIAKELEDIDGPQGFWKKFNRLIVGLYYMSPFGAMFSPIKHKLIKVIIDEIKRSKAS